MEALFEMDMPAGTFERVERLRDPDEYHRALLRIDPDKQWTEEDLKSPECMARAILLMEKVARKNAPEGVDPFEVDVLDVKAGLFLGLSEEEAIELGRDEAVRRIVKYISIGTQNMQA